ncbi:MAG: efflux RND transporter periplasmic adaptor subunit [Pyrinomonadaceae bacterium]|nr:efflux RND transporter periplasmic adaptor subunit [Phycisphaerales bacterium]
MVRKYVLPLLAVAGVALAVHTVRSENQEKPAAAPAAPPARSTFQTSVAGSGIIEASTQNIAIGTHLPGIITKLNVQAGDRVKAGDPLFSIDDRSVRSEMLVRSANVEIARQSLARLEQMPRPEVIPPLEAKVAEEQAALDDVKNTLGMWESVADPRAIVAEELSRKRYAVATAQARLAAAKSQLDEVKAGAWKPEMEVSRAQMEAAESLLQSSNIELERHTVRAPVDGQILQCNIRAGEYAQIGALATPMILLGNTDTLHVRVDVDENDAWRVKAGARARVSLRGNSTLGTDVTFVRIEPYVVPKRSLTGESSERVDTRVLQVLYSFPRNALNAYVGQLVDVYIEGEGLPGETTK